MLLWLRVIIGLHNLLHDLYNISYKTWFVCIFPRLMQIYGYRMSLWAEHLGFLEQGFEEPENMECVRRVRHLSELNWRQYAAEEVTVMTSHLLKYPVQVDRTGKVSSLPGCKTFPDVGGKIIGHVLWAGTKPRHLEVTL